MTETAIDTSIRPGRRPPHRLCERLRDIRNEAGLSLAQVSALCGLPAVVIGAYERGDREPPLHKLDRILNVYGLALEATYTGTQSIRPTRDVVSELRTIADQLEFSRALR